MLGALKPLIDLRDYKINTTKRSYPKEFSCGNPEIKD